MHFEEQLADIRSNEAAYRLAIENRGSTPMLIRSLTPRLPTVSHSSKFATPPNAQSSSRTHRFVKTSP
jgi:rare lipoprotein A (peptidoglycan hydrolase)